MPTIDKRFLLKLLLVLLTGFGALLALHAWQARRIPDALKAQAVRAAEAGNYAAAQRQLRQYLEFRPDDLAARRELARLLQEGGGSLNELHFLYDGILRDDPTQEAIRRDALLLALRTFRFTDAVAHAETLLKTSPNDAAVWQQLAAAQAGLRQFDAARTSYETAVRVNPKDARAWQRLAQFYLVDLKLPDEARGAVDRMVAALPEDPAAYITRVRLGLAAVDAPLPPRAQDPVLADIDRALALAPLHPEMLIAKAERLQRHRDVLGARAVLAAGVAAQPDHQGLVRSLAWLELNRGNAAGAAAVLEDALPHAKDGLDLLVPLADLLLESNDVARVAEILHRLERRPNPAARLQAKYLKARLAMKERRWQDAATMLVGLRTEAVNLPGLEAQCNLLLSQCYQKLGEPEQAVEALKMICAKDATHVAAHVALGLQSLTLGRTGEAIKAYETAAASPFAAPATLSMLIRIKALQLAHKNARPESWAALDKQVQEWAPRYGSNAVEPVLLRAELLQHAGRWRDAAILLREEVTHRPSSTALWCRLAETLGRLDGIAAGLQVLDEAQAFIPDGAELRLARARLYAADPLQLRPLEPLLVGTEHWSEAEQVAFASGMIEVYDSLGCHEPRLWETLLTRRPHDDELKEAHRRAMANQTKAPGALHAEWLKVAENRPLVQDQTKAPAPLQAAAVIETQFRREPNRIETTADWLALKVHGNDLNAVSTCLFRMAVDPRWQGEPLRRAVARAARQLPPRPRAELLNLFRPLAARDPGGLGWLASQFALFDRAQARSLAQAAVEVSSANVDDWLRLLHCTEMTDRRQVLHQAAATLNASQAAIFLAAITLHPQLQSLGDPPPDSLSTLADPRAVVSARLAILQARLDRDAAVQLLENYLAQPQVQPADRAWATRQLALLLVVRGGTADRNRAANLLTEPSLSQSGLTLAEHRTTAGTLAGLHRYLDGPARTAALGRAIELMEQVATATAAPQDAFALCGLYKAAGRTDDAVSRLQQLLQGDPGNIDYLLAGLDVLVEARQLEAARGFADRLVQLGGAEYRVVAAVAHYEALCGHGPRALELAEGYFRTADPLAGDVPVKAARTAELLDALSRLPTMRGTPTGTALVNAAVHRYETLLPARSEALVKIAAVLAAAGRVDEALQQIDKLARGLPPRIAATAAVTALHQGGAEPQQVDRAKQWLQRARTADPGSIAVRLIEAEFYAVLGDLNAAIAVYEAILTEQPGQVAASNNLAWLLAADPATAPKALALLESAAREAGLNEELLDTRARVRLGLGDASGAAADAAEALRLQPTALRHFHLALALRDTDPAASRRHLIEARDRGLNERDLHPADRAIWRALQADLH